MSRLVTKLTILSVRPAKTQISLGIRPVWPKSLLIAQLVAKDLSFLHADSEDWSVWADAQADLSLRWVHMPFCSFCHEAAQMPFCNPVNINESAKFYQHIPTGSRVMGIFRKLTQFHKLSSVHLVSVSAWCFHYFRKTGKWKSIP